MRLRPLPIALVPFVLVVLLAPVAAAQTTWTGAVSSNWSLAGNWAGAVPTASIDAVIPSGTPNAPSTAGVANAACRDLTVDAGATLTIAAGSPLSVNRDLTATGTVSGGGLLKFVGPATSWFSAANPMSVNVECAKSPGFDVRPFVSLTVTGNLTQTSGNLNVSTTPGITFSVLGNASLQGGALTSTQAAILDVAGNLTIAGTTVTSTLSTIRCGGNWSSDAGFAPTNALVVLDGAGAQSITAVTPFKHLTIEAGSTATASAAGLTTIGALTVNGSLSVTAGPLDVDGDLSVAPGGALDLGGGSDTFAAAFTILGTLTGAGTVVFDGPNTGPINASAALPAVVCAKSGTGQVRPLANLVISGNLTQTSGDLNIAIGAGIQVSVLGNALMQGGTLTATQTGILDVAGSVTFSGTVASGSIPTIRCAGNWSSDASFAPASGTVELDGAAPTTIATAAAAGTLAVPAFAIKNGPRSMSGDFTVAASAISVDAGGTLVVGAGRHLRVHSPAGPTAFAVGGTLVVSANGELSMGPQTNATIPGSLTLVGTAAQPAKITGEAGGGYGLVVAGTLAAKDFVVKEMGAGGLVVDFPATIAPAPNDLRSGAFDFRAGAPAGSVLLDLRRQAPAAAFDGLAFLNTPAAAGVFNVTTSASGVPITFTNWSGAFAGPAFENDPGASIGWNLLSPPVLAGFQLDPGAELAEIVWAMSNQTGVAGFQIRRGTNAAGPFPVIASPGVGGPGYGHVDQPLPANQTRHYLLYASMAGSESFLLASGSATPYSAAPPPNVYKVGGGGPFATIQAAINAATAANSVVWVTPGGYPSFSIGATAPANLHVLGDGTGPVAISTATGPITISNLPASTAVELSNLVVGTSSTAQDGIVVTSCAGPVVLDQVDVACSGAHTAVQVTSSPLVAIQRSTLQGATGLLLSAGSHVAISRGFLSSVVSTGSTIEMADLTPGSVNVTPPSSLVVRQGLMPDLNLPELVKLSQPSAMFLNAFPSSPYIVIASPRLGFATIAPLEMPVLVDLVGMAELPPLVTDASGFAVFGFEVPPNATLLGFTYVVQAGVLDLSTNAWRFSNVETMVGMP